MGGREQKHIMTLTRLPARSARWTSGSAGKPLMYGGLVIWNAEPVQSR